MNARHFAVVGLVTSALTFVAQADFTLPPEFTIQNAAEPPKVRYPMFAAIDDAGRLFVAESSGLDLYEELQKQTRRCRVSLLTDGDEDGRYEASSVFVDRLVFPMGLVWHRGKLFVADPPDLICLEDTDHDGRADRRTVLLTGFGHLDNGSLHGLVIGPDGFLYMTTGQPDGYRLKRLDGSILEGKSGALLRCKTDGSHVEVIARGFENLVEVVFLPGGEIIGTDNWFRLPQEGIRDALVHLIPGGVYPLNAHPRTESGMFNSGELLPAIQLYPAVAHSGLFRYTGTQFPAAMHGSLFSAQFNTRKVVRHQLRRSGATFETQDEDFLSTADPDFHPSDVLQDRDGSLLVIDTGSWYVQHCPTGRIRKTSAEGGVLRVRFSGKQRAASTEESSDDILVRKVRSLATESQLIPILSDPATHVRCAAAEALARCGTGTAVPALVAALTKADGEPFLTHVLVYALRTAADTRSLRNLLEHPHTEVNRAALVLLDQNPHRSLPADAALKALQSSNARLRSAAIAAFKNHPEWATHVGDFLHKAMSEGMHGELLRDLFIPFQTPQLRQGLLDRIGDAKHSRTTTILLLGIVRLCQFERSEQDRLKTALQRAFRSMDPAIVSEALRVSAKGLQADYVEISSNARFPLTLRLEALRAMTRQHPTLSDSPFELLMTGLRATNAPSLRLNAAEIASTAQLSSNQFQAFLAEAIDDSLISPGTVFAAAQKSGYIPELLSYLARSVRAGWQVPDTVKTWLRGFASKTELERILAEPPDRVEEHRKLLTDFEPLLSGGDPNRGHQIFLGAAGCVACHRIGKNGGLLGPDLTRIAAVRSPQDVLESLLIPSASIAQGYDAFEVDLADGESLSGIRVRQPDDSFVLRDATGAETRLDPSRIARIVPLKNSLMPDGLLTPLDRDSVRDLLAYLQSLK